MTSRRHQSDVISTSYVLWVASLDGTALQNIFFQVAESAPSFQMAESAPSFQLAESAPSFQLAESAHLFQMAESAPSFQMVESTPTRVLFEPNKSDPKTRVEIQSKTLHRGLYCQANWNNCRHSTTLNGKHHDTAGNFTKKQ